MSKKLHASDLEILLQVFIPGQYELHLADPKGNLVLDKDFLFRQAEDVPKVLVSMGCHINHCKTLELDSFDYIFEFGQGCALPKGFASKQFSYINNPNQTIRWFFPKNLKTPSFLNFYNAASWKAKLFKTATTAAFKLSLGQWLTAGCFQIHHRKHLQLDQYLQEVPHTNYSVFMGTVGVNRKVLAEVNTEQKTTHFIKIPLGRNTQQLINNEKRALQIMAATRLEKTVVPHATTPHTTTAAILSNVQPKRAKRQSKLTELHIDTLVEWYRQSTKSMELQWTNFDESTRNNIAMLRFATRFEQSKNIQQLLKSLHQSIPADQRVPVAYSHGDFTPWNLFATDHQLHVYDWEFFSTNRPVLFDLFHFIFQSEVLLHRSNYATIKQEINRVLALPALQRFVKEKQLNTALQLKLYLLANVSYYLNLYEQQRNLHQQAYWLIDVWQDALLDLQPESEECSNRETFIKQWVAELNSYKYAWLKFHEGRLDNVSPTADIDLLVQQSDLPNLIQLATKNPLIKASSLRKKSFMTTIELTFKDNSFLSIDLIHKFQRKWTNMLCAKQVLSSTQQTPEQINVPAPEFDLEYVLLFYTLNGAEIPQKYQRHFKAMSIPVQNRMLNRIQATYQLNAISLEDLFQHSTSWKDQLWATLQNRSENRGFNGCKSQLNYLMDSLRSIVRGGGFCISFSGVDGAGKSTTISNMAAILEKKYRRKVVVLRHRPSILPILSALKYGKAQAQQRAANTLPRKGKNASFWASALRFSYYLSDYLLGQFYIYAKHILRGEIVLYDRYYFDFINDAKRSNIVLPKSLIQRFYSLVFKPELNIFLYASPEVILARKRELSESDILKLTHDYRSLFTDLEQKYDRSRYIQIENIDQQETIDTILRELSKAA